MPLSKFFAKLIPLITITLLLFNLLVPVSIAFAQDADPPPDSPPAEEVIVEEEEVAEEQPVEEEAAEAPEEPNEPAPQEENPIPETEEPDGEETADEPDEEGAEAQEEPAEANEPEADNGAEPVDGEEAGDEALEEENPVAEAVEALDEADAMLLDEEGEPLSMASQEAAAALTVPDPQFCPAGLSFGDVGCGPVRTTMADAIADALAASTSNISGTIFVESGNFDGDGLGGDILLDGFNNNTSLTIQGNANGLGTTTFTTAFLVGTNNSNLFSSLTFNDVTFDAGVVVDSGTFIDPNTGDLSFNDVIANNATGNGIAVDHHAGDVSLDNVTANNTGGIGAAISSSGTVTVTDSDFNGNTLQGLLAGGSEIVLNNVNANNNSGSQGAFLNATIIDVSNSTFNNNTASGASGLEASGGVITLNGVTASGNDTTGILAVGSNITLNNVTANNNGEGGAVLSIPIEVPFANQSINVFNSNFDSNGNGASTPLATGLEINTVHSVTLDNVSASNNNGYRAIGVSIIKYGAFGDHLKITNSSFDNNVGVEEATGLYIETNGSLTPGYAITLDNVSASGNNAFNSYSFGAWINTGSTSVGSDRDIPINISNSNFDNNLGFGLFISSQGDVNLDNVSANGSFASGVFVDFDSSNGPHNASIVCSSMQNNGHYGIDVFGQGGEDLTILSTNTSGNGISPLDTINVSNIFIGETDCNPGPGDDDHRDGKHAPLDPNEPTPIVLDLYPHSVTFPPMNLLECEGFVRSLFYASDLPGELNAGDTFLRALKMRIEGCEIPADGLFTIGFDIPASEQGNQFAVLFWDGATGSWVEVPGQLTEDGHYTVSWPTTGTFVLVTR